MPIDQDLTQRVLQLIRARIACNTLPVPSMRLEIAQCLSMVSDPNVSFKKLAEIIERDPGLAARVLWVSNSAMYGGLARPKTVMQAVKRLGVQSLRAVLVEASAHELFEPEDERLRDACSGLWAHSRAVALVARELAKVMGRDRDEFYLAGLLHDIGKPIVAAVLFKAEASLGAPVWDWSLETWVEALQITHRMAGYALVKKWSLPEWVASAVTNSIGYDATDKKSIANCICYANAFVQAEGIDVEPLDADEVDQMLRDGQQTLGLSEANVERLREGLQAHAPETTSLRAAAH